MIALAPALVAAGCTSSSLDPNAHVWGTYSACHRRLSDECPADAVGGCRTEPASLKTLSLAVSPDGGFYWTREGLEPLQGRQAGARFLLRTTVPAGANTCGCVADVEETIVGELREEAPVPPACEGSGDAGCGSDGGRESLWFSEGLPGDGWLESVDGGIELDRTYKSFRALVTDVAMPDGGSCPCLPCRVVFEVQGTR